MWQNKAYIAAFVFLFIPLVVWAQMTNSFMDAETLPNLTKTIQVLKEQTKLPVIFPQKIPLLPKQSSYYIYTEAEPGNARYMISIDKTADCHGKHNCMVGKLIASVGNIPQIYYSMDNQELTVPVQLNGGRKGYFTPSHAMADFWSPQIEWREGNVLYQLSWNLAAYAPEKDMLVTMANSIIKY